MNTDGQTYRPSGQIKAGRAGFKSRSFIALIIFSLITLLSLYMLSIIPVQRVPADYFYKTEPQGIDPNGMVTRGVIEAKKQHKSHSAPNPDHGSIPSQFVTSPKGLPLGNYIVMIDAGSSGSRVYVYQYKLPFSVDPSTGEVIPGHDPSADLLHVAVAEDSNHNPIVRKAEPGLSSYENNPHDAFTSIEPLIIFAAESIPKQLHSTTPIYVYATAGLRLLDEENRNDILSAVRKGLKRYSDQGIFSFIRDDQADVITGEQEGLYGWIALNYIYNRFGDLGRTYPTGGLDPHTYGSLARVTRDEYAQILAQQGPIKPNKHDHHDMNHGSGNHSSAHRREALSAFIVDDPLPGYGTPLDNTNNNTSQQQHMQSKHQNGRPTVGLLEIGGGSSQVAFQVDTTTASHPPDYVTSINLDLVSCSPIVNSSSSSSSTTQHQQQRHIRTDKNGRQWYVGGHNYSVYTASFLGYGANAARVRYVNYLLDTAIHVLKQDSKHKNNNSNSEPRVLLDPCMIHGQAEIVSRKDGWGTSYVLPRPAGYKPNEPIAWDDWEILLSLDTSFLGVGQLLLVGSGEWDQCRTALIELLPTTPPSLSNTKDECPWHCPIGGQYQPQLTGELAQGPFFGFSEYWFTTRDVLRITPHDFNGELFHNMSLELCDRHHSKVQFNDIMTRFEQGHFPDSANELRIRQQCFKGAWMATMMHEGHGIPKNKQPNVVVPVSSIEGSEVQWSLGAVLLRTTQRLQSDPAYCMSMADANGFSGVGEHLYEAKIAYLSHNHNRLMEADFWGSIDARWNIWNILLFLSITGMLAMLTSIILMQSWTHTIEPQLVVKKTSSIEQ